MSSYKIGPRYPVFIPSKGRFDTNLTAKTFDQIGVDYTIFIESQEYDQYAAVIDPKKIFVVPHQNKGVTVTRNFMWDYAQSLGVERYWSFDDNIEHVYRMNRNKKLRVLDGAFFNVIEDFVDRYENVPIAGMQYDYFARNMDPLPAFYYNNRVYSNMLIQTNFNDAAGKPFRFDLYFNEDTDLCIRVMRAGYCPLLFNAFLIGKAATMTMKGGNTENYFKDKRQTFVDQLVAAHPDIVRQTEKFGRIHHQVDYRKFKVNKLKRKANFVMPAEKINNYGMVLKPITKVAKSTIVAPVVINQP